VQGIIFSGVMIDFEIENIFLCIVTFFGFKLDVLIGCRCALTMQNYNKEI
jgi:hypothetical protein